MQSVHFGILARVEQIQAVIPQPTITPEAETRRPHTRWCATVRNREADGLRLVGDDVHLLEAGGGGVDAEEGEAVGAGGEGVGDEGLGVGLVLDGAEVGGGVGVGQAISLQVVQVEGAAIDVEGNVAGSLALF